MVRGINRQDIFNDGQDRKRYLDTLKRVTVDSSSELYGYCLMSNHIHLVIKEGEAGISNVMKRLGASYAYWYNLKYQRTGHVFQDRFKSECIEDDSYLMTVVRYVHRNPVKALVVNKPEEYIWSSCRVYYGATENPPGLTQVSLVLDLFANQEKQAIERMRIFEAEENDDCCLDEVKQIRLNEDKAFNLIREKLKEHSIAALQSMPQNERKEAIKQLKAIDGLSLRQIVRITGLSYHEIYYA
jgi:REP element-mobilizing transposase RayT